MSDNLPNGPTFADGFHEQGMGNFTSMFGCTNGVFCDINLANRNGNWAVDINNVAGATDTTNPVPEPGTLLLVSAGVAGLSVLRRRRKFDLH
jgi:hypothetical protein